MASAEVLRLTHIINNKVTVVINGKSAMLATREAYVECACIG